MQFRLIYVVLILRDVMTAKPDISSHIAHYNRICILNNYETPCLRHPHESISALVSS